MYKLLSPIDGAVVAEVKIADLRRIDDVLHHAQAAYRSWRRVPLAERKVICQRAMEYLEKNKAVLGKELTEMMGRPSRYVGGEIDGCVDRGRTMIALADDALANIEVTKRRYMERAPLGVVFVIPAWNYPYLIAVNSIVPALLAGNAVVVKHSAQTARVGDRFAEAFAAAGAPAHLLQALFTDHAKVAKMVQDRRVDHVCFTGSVSGGRAISKAAGGRFIATGLELGGKDPAYVREDADVDFATSNLVDGSFFNSGQSCCGIERIYVHRSKYDAFLEAFLAKTKPYVLGDPRDAATTLGPMAKASGADSVCAQVGQAVAAGATAHIDPTQYDAHGNYLAPQVLTEVDHTMAVMRQETFGPVACIMKVKGDAEAIALMNDSPYGLTASIWTADVERAAVLGGDIETGTVFANRCDYLDPELAWVGVKDTGRGATLSKVGFENLTRPKSFHLRGQS